MMDTILNLGLNDATVKGLAAKAGNERFAYDSYRRFIQMYADVVLGVDHGVFEDILETTRTSTASRSTPISAPTTARGASSAYKAAVERETGKPFPQDPPSSCGAPSAPCSAPGRTRAPRPTAACTASPTAGARPSTCRPWCSATWATTRATGVAFTRNPSTGERELYGEFLVNAQGEDVVAGIRTPQPLTEARARRRARQRRRSKR